jgi:tripartite-type tricarboxylate transporter receptor subunit TctC
MDGIWKHLFVATSIVLSAMPALVSPLRAIAADYPSRPLRLVVPFPPGGAADILARGIAPALAERLHQQIVVDNRPGANGVIGFELVARSPADGYTLLLGFTTGVAINPLLVKVSYDPERDFVPISMLSRTPMTLIASPSFPGEVRAGPDSDVEGRAWQVELRIARNRQSQPSCRRVVQDGGGCESGARPLQGRGPGDGRRHGGHVPIAFVTLAAALPQVRSGKLKSLAITSDKRGPRFPRCRRWRKQGWAEWKSSSGSDFWPLRALQER